MKENKVRKIVITGPESSGKSTLAEALAGRFQTVWTPEYARDYLQRLGRPYEEADLLHIARGQLAWEADYAGRANRLLFCDTGLVVLKIWSEYKYGRCHPFILDALQTRTYHLYLLCRPDLPWTFDPLRENPDDRDELFTRYQQELQKLGAHFVEIAGDGPERLRQAVTAIQSCFRD